MGDQNGKDASEDWEAIYPQLYAYTDDLLKKKSWFRGKKTDSYLKGKTIEDYVSEAIWKYLSNPEKFDATSGRSLVNYLKLHIIRTLVGNDAKAPENKTSKDVFAIADKKQQDDDDSYLDSVLPYAEVFFDQEIDFKEIMTEIENEISKDEVAEKIYFGERYDGLKRAQIIEENKMSEKEFNNGKRRMQTILDTVAKKYNIKKPVL